MRYLWRILTSSSSVTFIGLICISAIIWWQGPYLTIHEFAPLKEPLYRLIFIAVLFQLWIIFLLYRYLRDRYFASQINKQVAAEAQSTQKQTKEEITITPGAIEAENEIAILNKKMTNALATLRKVKFRGIRRGHYLYQRPWYLLIGAPGAGKTTLLLRSGLKFLLSDKFGHRSVGGVGGTRHCDWWFTEEAVLLDTAGRFTTQDSFAVVDKTAWLGFLDIIKRNRKQKPINGVIVTISLMDLLTADENTRTKQAIAIRNRINELYEKFTIRFPIYIMISKCDLLQGFVEFFSDLNKNDREQVWGMTFPAATLNDVNKALHMFPSLFLELEKNIQSRVISRIHDEHKLSHRALMMTFPQQFASIGESIEEFLAEILQSNQYEEKTMLRGIYFTSSTQEGSPIDRILGAMTSFFKFDRQALIITSGKSYFVSKLLKQVIFPESHLAGSDSKYDTLFLWLRRIGLVGLASIFIASGYLLWQSYYINNQYIQSIQKRAKVLVELAAKPIDSTSLLAVLPLLDNTKRISENIYIDNQKLVAFPLSQINRIEAENTQTYNRLLKEALLPRLISRVKVHLARGSAYKFSYLYQLLRVYIMMGEPQHFQVNELLEWFKYDFNNNLPSVSPKDLESLTRHTEALSYLLEDELTNNKYKIEIDKELIEQTRSILANLSIQDWIYENTTNQLSQEFLKVFSVADAAGSQANSVFYRKSGSPLSRGIDGVFTVDGYQSFKKTLKLQLADLAKNSWVFADEEALNTPQRIDAIYNSVLEQYYQDYINAWKLLLEDIGILQFSNLNQGIRIIELLTADESPLVKLLRSIVVETTLTPNDTSDPEVSKDPGVFGKYKSKLTSILNNNQENILSPSKPSPTIVDIYFEPLANFVGTGEDKTAPLNTLITNLSEIANYFQAIHSTNIGQPTNASDKVLSAPSLSGNDNPLLIRSIVEDIKKSSLIISTNNLQQRLNLLWDSEVSTFCHQAIKGRYPNNKKAKNDISVNDFGRFFAKNGLMDSFFDQNLKNLVKTTDNSWKWIESKWGGNKPSSFSLQQFRNAAQIRDSFFTKGGQKPSAAFEVSILSISSKISYLLLNIEGQTLIYQPGRTNNRMVFQVPSGRSNNRSSLSTTIDGKTNTINTSGYWSWWRLMDKGILEKTPAADQFRLTFNLQGNLIIFGIQASSVYNSINLQSIKDFRCPTQLISISKK